MRQVYRLARQLVDWLCDDGVRRIHLVVKLQFVGRFFIISKDACSRLRRKLHETETLKCSRPTACARTALLECDRGGQCSMVSTDNPREVQMRLSSMPRAI